MPPTPELQQPELVCFKSDDPKGREWCRETDRVRVPGGWLYRTFYDFDGDEACSVSTTFVPDVRWQGVIV